jgi:hypothetical protein
MTTTKKKRETKKRAMTTMIWVTRLRQKEAAARAWLRWAWRWSRG